MAYYSKTILDHFLHPKHMGRIENADGVGSTQNMKCGDEMTIYIRVENGRIKDARFEAMGCSHAIASSDMICELASGKTLEEAKNIGFKDVLLKLGEMPPQKIHCSSLAEYALKEAIKDYESKR